MLLMVVAADVLSVLYVCGSRLHVRNASSVAEKQRKKGKSEATRVLSVLH